jgi:hypothetical protein
MMGIVVPETCVAYKKYSKTISDIQLVFLFSSYHNDARCNTHPLWVLGIWNCYRQVLRRYPTLLRITSLCSLRECRGFLLNHGLRLSTALTIGSVWQLCDFQVTIRETDDVFDEFI